MGSDREGLMTSYGGRFYKLTGSGKDFVFVDAAHTAAYVRNDSEKAWAMLRPGGIVAWHDCRPQSPDVVKYLRNCPFAVSRISGTTLAFATKPVSP